MNVHTHASLRLAAGIAALLTPTFASATNGYFTHGNSVKSNGIAGIGIALPQDALAAASNPAGTVLVGDRLDLGATWFAPRRSADIVGNAYGADAHYDGDDRENFVLPEVGYTRAFGDRYAWGIALYGNGGMSTDYGQNPYARFGATGKAGVNLEQIFITPSFAVKLNERHSLGIGLNLLYQRFEAKGIGFFGAFSQSPNNVSNRGTDTSTGVGIRLGWNGQFSDSVTVGASWSSKIKASEFDRYKGLFADNGSFDVPENYGIGIALKATSAATIAAEVQRINYSDVRSVGQPLAPLLQGVPLGASSGPGFGWDDVTVYKLGVQYTLTPQLTVRAGFSHSDQPVPETQTFFNILAPGVVENHVTLGATWTTRQGNEVSGYLAHASSKRVAGSGSIPANFGGGEADLKLSENLLGVSYAWKF